MAMKIGKKIPAVVAAGIAITVGLLGATKMVALPQAPVVTVVLGWVIIAGAVYGLFTELVK